MTDISDADGLWRIKDNTIINRTTNEVRIVKNIPSANTIAYMNYTTFRKDCQIAFNTGVWPSYGGKR